MASSTPILCALLFLVFSSWVLTARSQSGGGGSTGIPCVKKLLPCAPYLQKTDPPVTCCIPLEELLKGDVNCLCAILYNKELLKSFNVTQDQVLKLPTHCGLKAPDVGICKNTTEAPTQSPPASATPPATPSKGTSTSNASHGKSVMGAVSVLMAIFSAIISV